MHPIMIPSLLGLISLMVCVAVAMKRVHCLLSRQINIVFTVCALDETLDVNDHDWID
jgi:hypothetical protein